MSGKINFRERLATFTEHWQPRTVAEFNGHDVMVAKLHGEFVWHHHDDTDDLFLVLEGRVRIELRDGAVELGPGEMYVVPKGVEHRPVAGGGSARPPHGGYGHTEHRRSGDRGASGGSLAPVADPRLGTQRSSGALLSGVAGSEADLAVCAGPTPS